MDQYLTPAACLPADGTAGTLVGRAWLPGEPGPGRPWWRCARTGSST